MEGKVLKNSLGKRGARPRFHNTGCHLFQNSLFLVVQKPEEWKTFEKVDETSSLVSGLQIAIVPGFPLVDERKRKPLETRVSTANFVHPPMDSRHNSQNGWRPRAFLSCFNNHFDNDNRRKPDAYWYTCFIFNVQFDFWICMFLHDWNFPSRGSFSPMWVNMMIAGGVRISRGDF